ncbi:MAG: class I SAM-dependent methyltransferase [bacterium]
MKKVFDFGKNWQNFVKMYLNDKRIEEAKRSLCEFLEINDLTGKTFLDIGCGSGLFSLAALRLGTSKVVSFDVDPFSVKCAKTLWQQEGSPVNWEIFEGSVLDEGLIKKLGTFDIVYSWGVLHHTGDMWQAIENATYLVNKDGLLYIAIYNKADGVGIYPDGRFGPSKFWQIEKRIYSQLPAFVQNLIDFGVMGFLILAYLLTFNNPIKKIRNHISLRGMSWHIDIKDWLGGYPYEYASVSEIFKFMKKKGFELMNLKNNNGLMNNEYLFKKIIAQ